MLTEMVNVLMSAEIDATCGAGYGERSDERVNSRNGYRARPWDTRVGTSDLQIPKLPHGTYFPGWLLEPRRRAEKAPTAVVAEAYLLGVSTRKVEGREVEEVLRARCYPTRAIDLDREEGDEPRRLFYGRPCAGRYLAVVAAPRPGDVMRPITCWPLSEKSVQRHEAWRKTVKR